MWTAHCRQAQGDHTVQNRGSRLCELDLKVQKRTHLRKAGASPKKRQRQRRAEKTNQATEAGEESHLSFLEFCSFTCHRRSKSILPSASMEDRSRATPRAASARGSLVCMLVPQAHSLMKESAGGSSDPSEPSLSRPGTRLDWSLNMVQTPGKSAFKTTGPSPAHNGPIVEPWKSSSSNKFNRGTSRKF